MGDNDKSQWQTLDGKLTEPWTKTVSISLAGDEHCRPVVAIQRPQPFLPKSGRYPATVDHNDPV
jgi:hypothetical protein